MLKAYYELGKPRLAYGNLVTTVAGFLFAAHTHASWLLAPLLLGMTGVIMSACVFNNYFDRHIDAKMVRTQKRGLAVGTVSVGGALVYGAALGIAGFALLYIYVNALTAAVALLAFVVYVGAYTPLKSRTHWAVLVGALSGASPIVAGYTAVAGALSAPAFILFLILVLWQMPHFYAISMYREGEYAAAGIPLLPMRVGMQGARHIINSYIAAFIVAGSLFAIFHFAGFFYFLGTFLGGFTWLVFGLRGPSSGGHAGWAKRLFRISLLALLNFCLFLALAPLLP